MTDASAGIPPFEFRQTLGRFASGVTVITAAAGQERRGMTASAMDSLPGVGPARRRAILRPFWPPERFLAATREEMEAVPGHPPKVARDLYEHLNKSGGSEQVGTCLIYKSPSPRARTRSRMPSSA